MIQQIFNNLPEWVQVMLLVEALIFNIMLLVLLCMVFYIRTKILSLKAKEAAQPNEEQSSEQMAIERVFRPAEAKQGEFLPIIVITLQVSPESKPHLLAREMRKLGYKEDVRRVEDHLQHGFWVHKLESL